MERSLWLDAAFVSAGATFLLFFIGRALAMLVWG